MTETLQSTGQPASSNIVVGKLIDLILADGLQLSIPSFEAIEVLYKKSNIQILANQLLKMDLKDLKFCHEALAKAPEIKSINFRYVHKKLRDLQIGDQVMTPDGEKATVKEICKSKSKRILRFYLSDGRFFDCNEDHRLVVHFRNSDIEQKKVYDTLEAKYIYENLNKYTFEIPTDETFSWTELDYFQFLEMIRLHDREFYDTKSLVLDLEKTSGKVYIDKIEVLDQQEESCSISLTCLYGLYLTESGIIICSSSKRAIYI